MTKILIVDDHENNLYYLEALLNGHGFTTLSAKHGAEALVKARQTRPDLIISDLLMPVMDGYTLLRHWRYDHSLKRIPFIVHTATYTEPEDEELAMSLGADAFILKPTEPDNLLHKVRELLDSRETVLPSESRPHKKSEELSLKLYSEALIRKLEEKTMQLEEANRELQLDIAQRKKAEARIEQLAFYDPLTGLPNRRLMQDRLEHSIASSSRLHYFGALLFIDLDNFKTLNDSRGHNAGDDLLRMVSTRLESCVREGDTVSRFGGDEFVVILEALSESLEQAASMAEHAGDRMLESLSKPYVLQNEDFRCTASIGVSLFRDREISAEELVRRADTAMYQAKQSGRNALFFYDPGMQAALEARLQLENDLRRALEDDQFALYYQPQVDHEGCVIGAEALLRWICPRRGVISPAEFIPLAEETGLILPIGNWVLAKACTELKSWESLPDKSALQLAVNVSARQFHQHNFVEIVRKQIRSARINPSRLKLELTESSILDDTDAAINKMAELKADGVRFAMDDFGTGYSSLSYLTRLPLDQLKIDQSFVHNMEIRHVDSVIVQTIIGMARNLEMEVIAEGVETEEQYRILKEHDCLLFQGYYFGRPMPPGDFNARLTQAGQIT